MSLLKRAKQIKKLQDFLNLQGYHSPMKINQVLLNTVKCIRLKNRVFIKRSQSHPRHIAGFLTISQISEKMGVSHHWIYDRIHNGKIKIKPVKIAHYKNSMYLFPDTEETLHMFENLKSHNF